MFPARAAGPACPVARSAYGRRLRATVGTGARAKEQWARGVSGSIRRLALLTWAGLVLAAPSTAWAGAGEPDQSFGSGGVFSHEFTNGGLNSYSGFRAVALAPGAKIDVVGVSDERDDFEVLAVRLTEQGSFDSTFGSGGTLITALQPPTYGQITIQPGEAELVQADGSIVVGGPGMIGRLTPSGQLDPGFQHDGNRIRIFAIASLPGGELLTAGEERSGPAVSSPAAIERLLPNGARDPSFGHEGEVHLPLHPGERTREQARAAIALPEGKVLLAGSGSSWISPSSAEGYIWLARLNPDGSLDSSFGTAGIDYLPSNGGEVALVRQPSGRLVLLSDTRTEAPGPWSETHGWQTAAWAFNEQGAPDTSFGQHGVTRLPSTQPELSNFFAAAAVDNQGRVLIASNQVRLNSLGAAAFVARLTATGQLDTGYGHGGLAVGIEGSGFKALAVDSSGRAIAAGVGSSGALVERSQSDTAPGAQQPGAISPVVTNVAESNRSWREGTRLASFSRKHKAPPIGTTFSVSVNVPASVTFTFARSASGRKVGKRCIALTKKFEKKHRCTRSVLAGTLTFSAHAGTNKARFEGLISTHKKLKPNSYTLLITATASGEHSTPRALHFTIDSR